MQGVILLKIERVSLQDLMAMGAKALLLHMQSVGSLTLGDPKQGKNLGLGARKEKKLLLHGQLVGSWTLGEPKQGKRTGVNKKLFCLPVIRIIYSSCTKCPLNRNARSRRTVIGR